jgi:long-chain acyl-CoA synthetase
LRVEGFLRESAVRFPDKDCLVCGGLRLSYEQIDSASNRAAWGLRSLGVGRGDRVVIQLDNGVESVVSIFAALKAGAAFVVVNPTTKAEKLAYILNDCQAAALVADTSREDVVVGAWARSPRLPATVLAGARNEWLLAEAPGKALPFDTLLEDGRAEQPDVRGIDLDLAALVYTSGSTGVPKGAMLTHRNITAASASITSYLENTEEDVILNVLPLSFDYGLYQVLMSCKVGASLVLERSFVYPPAVLARLVADRVTGFPIVPTIASLLLRQDLRTFDLSRLRYITNTGAALPPSHISALRALLPHVRLYSMYGLTECKRVSYLPPDEVDRRPDSVGKPMPNVEVFLVDDDGNRLDSGTGELVVRGSNVMSGYWGLPDETAQVLRPGLLPGERLLYTGDVFRIDEEGYLYFLARKDDVIKSRGEKVSPKEVEGVLHALPGVAEAVVIGVPDEVLGHAVKAFVVRSDAGLTEQEVLRHCAAHLESFMVPKAVEFLLDMPRLPSGKIDRRSLAAGCVPVGADMEEGG